MHDRTEVPSMDRRRRHERMKSAADPIGAIPELQYPQRYGICRADPTVARIMLLDVVAHGSAELNTWIGEHPETFTRVLLLDDGGLIYRFADFPQLLMHPFDVVMERLTGK